MSEEKSLVGQVIDQSSGVLEKAYDDLAASECQIFREYLEPCSSYYWGMAREMGKMGH